MSPPPRVPATLAQLGASREGAVGEWMLGHWTQGGGVGGSRLGEQQEGLPRPGEAFSSVAL